MAVEHVMPSQPLAALGGSGTQVPACTGVDTTTVLQSVRLWPLRSVAGSGVQDATVVGPLSRVSAGQVVVVQPFAPVGSDAAHEFTATFVVSFVAQLVVT